MAAHCDGCLVGYRSAYHRVSEGGLGTWKTQGHVFGGLCGIYQVASSD